MPVQTPRQTWYVARFVTCHRDESALCRAATWPKKGRIMFFTVHTVKNEGGKGKGGGRERKRQGARRVEDDVTRTRLSRCRGGCSARKYPAGSIEIGRKEWSSTTRTFRGRACTEMSVRLRTGSRCYLRDAAHGCAHNGETTRRSAHTTRTDGCVYTHAARIYR